MKKLIVLLVALATYFTLSAQVTESRQVFFNNYLKFNAGTGTTNRLVGKATSTGYMNFITIGSGLSLTNNVLSSTGGGDSSFTSLVVNPGNNLRLQSISANGGTKPISIIGTNNGDSTRKVTLSGDFELYSGQLAVDSTFTGVGGPRRGPFWRIGGNVLQDSTTQYFGSINAYPVIFKTNAVERMRINSVGNIGIDVDTPQYKLHVNGTFLQSYTNGVRTYYFDGTGLNDVAEFGVTDTDGTVSRFVANTGGSNWEFYGTAGADGQVFVNGPSGAEIRSITAGVVTAKTTLTSNGLAIGDNAASVAPTGVKLYVQDGDIAMPTIGSGIILKSPDGTCWKTTVSDLGVLTTVSITCP